MQTEVYLRSTNIVFKAHQLKIKTSLTKKQLESIKNALINTNNKCCHRVLEEFWAPKVIAFSVNFSI